MVDVTSEESIAKAMREPVSSWGTAEAWLVGSQAFGERAPTWWGPHRRSDDGGRQGSLRGQSVEKGIRSRSGIRGRPRHGFGRPGLNGRPVVAVLFYRVSTGASSRTGGDGGPYSASTGRPSTHLGQGVAAVEAGAHYNISESTPTIRGLGRPTPPLWPPGLLQRTESLAAVAQKEHAVGSGFFGAPETRG